LRNDLDQKVQYLATLGKHRQQTDNLMMMTIKLERTTSYQPPLQTLMNVGETGMRLLQVNRRRHEAVAAAGEKEKKGSCV
jgi:hypothetical protein